LSDAPCKYDRTAAPLEEPVVDRIGSRSPAQENHGGKPMQSINRRLATAIRGLLVAAIGLAAITATAGTAIAQTYGFATLPPGTLNHTTASAVSKVL